MQRSFFTLLFATFFLLAFPHNAHAAETATDKGITGILELDPSEVVAGKNVLLRFQFSSPDNSFQLQQCACELTITKPDRLPYQQMIEVTDAFAPHTAQHTNHALNNVGLTYRFPTEGKYTITVAGKAKEGQTFEPFTLHWDVSVKGTAETAPPTLQKKKSAFDNKVVLGSILMIVIIVIYLIVSHLQRKKKKEEK